MPKSKNYKHAECCIDDCFFLDLIDGQYCWGQIENVEKNNFDGFGTGKYHLCAGHKNMNIAYKTGAGDFWDGNENNYIREE